MSYVSATNTVLPHEARVKNPEPSRAQKCCECEKQKSSELKSLILNAAASHQSEEIRARMHFPAISSRKHLT